MNLRLPRISDSALPIGGSAHPWGLEAAIARRMVHDDASLERFVRGWLEHLLGPLEGVVVLACVQAAEVREWAGLARANDLLTASLAPLTLRAASQEMGELLLSQASTWG
jgi:urease accessory protein